MLSIILESNDPFINLATEEYLLQNRTEDFIVLSINDPAIIIGKHQVAHCEVNTRFVEETGTPVIRRISGGGTVYHDRGNLNYCFIRNSEKGKQIDFRLYTQPVVDFLNSLGVGVVFEGKNDLTLDGLKISGNAEHVFRERVLHHGTLLYDASLNNMNRALRQKNDNYSTRAVDSNRTRVTNLIGRFPEIRDINNLMYVMLGYFRINLTEISPAVLNDNELLQISNLAGSKYRSWEWNWGYGPPYTFTNWFETNNITHRCSLLVKDGIIWSCNIEGSNEVAAAGKKLIGCRHMYQDLLKVFRSENIPISAEELYKFF